MPLSEPWARVRIPVPVPDPLTVASVMVMTGDDLAELLRGHLIPASHGSEDRVRWASLWRLLADDDDLSDRAFDALEQMLDTTNDALHRGDLPDAANRRARIFRGRCEDAWTRLEAQEQESDALAWAGEKAVKYNPEARRVIATLVGAIAKHRAARTEAGSSDDLDIALWRALRQVGLDPRDAV